MRKPGEGNYGYGHKDFVPIILGTDMNAYGMARAFHEAYGIKSLVIGIGSLHDTAHSKIIHRKVMPDFDTPKVFTKTLIDLAKKHLPRPTIVISCKDEYSLLLIKNKKLLSKHMIVPYIDEPLMKKLWYKADFYKMCEKHGVPCPKTTVVNKHDYKTLRVNVDFPRIIKPSNSATYLKLDFLGKKKVFTAQTWAGYDTILRNVYAVYDEPMIVQEVIPGDYSNERSVHAYVGRDHKVKFVVTGEALAGDTHPHFIGNHLGILVKPDEELTAIVKKFLESVNYVGMANLDFKYDSRDGKIKAFEVNIRQGRSSYYVMAAGFNIAQYYINDWVYHRKSTYAPATKTVLWLPAPFYVLRRSVSPATKKQIDKLRKSKTYASTLKYLSDYGPSRRFSFFRNQARYLINFLRYPQQ